METEIPQAAPIARNGFLVLPTRFTRRLMATSVLALLTLAGCGKGGPEFSPPKDGLSPDERMKSSRDYSRAQHMKKGNPRAKANPR